MRMPKNAPRILALDPGTRKLGVALLEGDRLVYHGVKVFSGNRSARRRLHAVQKALTEMLDDFRPDIVAVERTFVTTNKQMALLSVLADEIMASSRSRGMQVIAVAPATVKKHVAGNGHATKEAVAQAVSRAFPELTVYLNQDRQWKARHHANMFDAVAVGLTARDCR